MRTSTHLLLAAVAACTLFTAPIALNAADPAKDTPAAASPAAASTFPKGIRQTDLKDKAGIQSALASAGNAVFSKNSLADLISCAVDQDRVRLNTYKVQDKNDMEALVTKLQTAWKNKYGQDFNIDSTKAYPDSFASILQGEISDTNQLVDKWPVSSGFDKPALHDGGIHPDIPDLDQGRTSENMTHNSDLTNKPDGAVKQTPGKLTADEARKTQDKTLGGDINLDNGRPVALVIIPADHGLPAITASLIHENPSTWRFDIPNNVSGQIFHDNLTRVLKHLDETQAQWPADVDDGYRMVTHAVVVALYNGDVSHVATATPTALNK